MIMHDRIEPLFAPISAALVGMLSSLTAMFQYMAVGWIDPNVITFTTLAGAIAGSFTSIVFFPPRVCPEETAGKTLQIMAAKFLASGFLSLALSPQLAHWLFGDTPSAYNYLFTAGVVGLCAHTIATALRRIVKKKLGKYEDESDGD